MEKIKKIFEDYVKNYDFKIKEVTEKYYHSYRVMDFSQKISKSINLNESTAKIVTIAGLFHDIARFKQWTEYQTFIDRNSFDHGDVGYEILKTQLIDKFDLTDEEKKIILKAVKNHNKYSVEDNLSEKELLVCNIVRDADKLDIMQTQGFITKNINVDNNLVTFLFKHELIRNEFVKNNMDSLLRLISFIYDLNFSYSYSYLIEKKIIEDKLKMVEKYGNTEIKDIYNDLIKYMKERA